MAIDLQIGICSECNSKLSDGDEVYCETCYNVLLDTIKKLEKEIERFENIMLEEGY